METHILRAYHKAIVQVQSSAEYRDRTKVESNVHNGYHCPDYMISEVHRSGSFEKNLNLSVKRNILVKGTNDYISGFR